MLHCNDIDGLMMDWLYGELDTSSAAEVSGHVEACTRCQAEQAAFSRTRDLFRQLPEEEPSASLTAMLVREAALSATPKSAVAVESTGGGGGFGEWLGRFFRPLMHPAAAAVATLVLVAGVAGTLYMKGGADQFAANDKVSADSAESSPAATPEAKAPAAPAKSALEGDAFGEQLETETIADGTTIDPGAGAPPPPTDRTADILDAKRESKLRRDLAANEGRAKRTEIAGLKQQAQKKGKGKRLAAAKEESRNRAEKARDGESDEDDGFASFDDAPRGAPVVTGSSAAYRGQRLGSDAWAENLEGKLLVAYKRDDCREAARIANDIRERNPGYYKKNTSDLDAVKKCRYYVNSERKRRTARARKAAKSKKSNASSTTKKAAPAQEQADAVEVE